MKTELNLVFCPRCWRVPCDCSKANTAYATTVSRPMVSNCEAPKVQLGNGVKLSVTYRFIHGATCMDIWAIDANGQHIASRSVVGACEHRIKRAINELKCEILSYEADKIARDTNNSLDKLISFITARYAELDIKKF